MAKRKTDATKFGEHIKNLFELFDKADKKKLEAALKTKDLFKLCKVLGVTEIELTGLLKKGSRLAQNLFGNFLKEAVSAFKKTTKV